MKIRTDFHSVNLATGEKTRSIVGDGEEVDETVGTTTQQLQKQPQAPQGRDSAGERE
jgi:hypothetical protein